LEFRFREGDREWENVDELVMVDWTPCTYGGRRPWFVCPGCRRRVRSLYAGGKHLKCRHCYRLTYASSRERAGDRAFRRARRIRRGLGAPNSMLAPPLRPKGMHWRTYSRLHNALAVAESEYWLDLARQLGIVVSNMSGPRQSP
jgi:hypothetical protein